MVHEPVKKNHRSFVFCDGPRNPPQVACLVLMHGLETAHWLEPFGASENFAFPGADIFTQVAALARRTSCAGCQRFFLLDAFETGKPDEPVAFRPSQYIPHVECALTIAIRMPRHAKQCVQTRIFGLKEASFVAEFFSKIGKDRPSFVPDVAVFAKLVEILSAVYPVGETPSALFAAWLNSLDQITIQEFPGHKSQAHYDAFGLWISILGNDHLFPLVEFALFPRLYDIHGHELANFPLLELLVAAGCDVHVAAAGLIARHCASYLCEDLARQCMEQFRSLMPLLRCQGIDKAFKIPESLAIIAHNTVRNFQDDENNLFLHRGVYPYPQPLTRFAAMYGNIEMLRLLLENGADPLVGSLLGSAFRNQPTYPVPLTVFITEAEEFLGKDRVDEMFELVQQYLEE